MRRPHPRPGSRGARPGGGAEGSGRGFQRGLFGQASPRTARAVGSPQGRGRLGGGAGGARLRLPASGFRLPASGFVLCRGRGEGDAFRGRRERARAQAGAGGAPLEAGALRIPRPCSFPYLDPQTGLSVPAAGPPGRRPPERRVRAEVERLQLGGRRLSD
ncbi:translation initiation factor IF-2-like [Vulpes lagopus]|uniref:translation initiation factor IF-2-like n=1 Tax=Vulpes lagopus TaxID=494514 RepID=UPI001BC92BCD|nr:translation initiation factor IF-2-like [Vulpes lagopus]